MASKQQQATEKLKVENAQQENEGEEQAAAPDGEESPNSGGGSEPQKPKRGLVRRLVPNFRWVLSSKHADRNEAKDDAEKFAGQMMEVRRKAKEQQMRHYMRFQTPEPDNHYDFCLIP